ncbi:resolvase [Halobacteriales archaeon QS_4_69_34]|nr:MAG: resolvase [Halobacteriales archaeon QS_4_69_34]
MGKQTAIYARDTTSTGSADDQREQALDYATEVLDADPANIVVLSDTTTEARAEPSSDDRRLFDLAAKGAIERVIVHDASRIAKNMRDLHERVTRLVENGVAVHVIEAGLRIGESGTDGGPDDRTLLRALGIAAELEGSVGSERTKEGIAAAKAAGKHVGRPPFGFDSDGAGGLVPNEDFGTALTVIEEIEAGESKRSTARRADITRATVQNVVDRKEFYLAHATPDG